MKFQTENRMAFWLIALSPFAMSVSLTLYLIRKNGSKQELLCHTLKELTKKNQEFIHSATSTISKGWKTDAEIKAILKRLFLISRTNCKVWLLLYLRSTNHWAQPAKRTISEKEHPKENDDPNDDVTALFTDCLQ